jgi:uncharacterized protein (TIGR03437 family)
MKFAMYLFAAMLCRGQGIITTYAGSDVTYPGSSFSALSASFGLLSGVAISPSGDVYFASSTRCLIVKFSPRLNSVSIVAGITVGGYSGDGGPAANAALNSPQQIAFDPAGNLYIADLQNNAIRKIDTQGMITTYATVSGPWSVAIAADGTLYVSTYSQVLHINPDGTQTIIAGSEQSGFGGDNGPAIDAIFNHIQGLLFDKAGNLLVVDTANSAIRRINTQGIVTTIAGNGQYGPSVTGPATSTPIANPVGLGLDAQGNLYTGTLYNQLLKISSTGTLTVLNSAPSHYFLTAPGPVAQAIFFPQFPAADSAGNLYFTDQRAGYLWELTTAGSVQVAAAYAPNFFIGDNGPATLAGLNFPNGIWLNADGSLLIADQYNLRVRKISPTGTITTIAGNGSLGTTSVGPALSVNLSNPTEVAADSSGNIYIALYGSNIVRLNTSSGMVSSFYTANSFVNAIAVDGQGNLLVAVDANQIVKITPAGAATAVAGTGQAGYSGDGGPAVKAMLNGPQGVTTDSAGNIYIGDSYNGLLRKVSPSGIITTIAGQGSYIVNGVPATQSSLHFPTALACDAAGDIYVADTYGSQVRVISANGMISAVAGTGTAAFSGDGGLATAASLNQAGTLAVDSAGNVYISDRLNNRIRKILVAPPSLSISSTQVTISGESFGAAAQSNITLNSSVQGTQYSIAFSTQSGGDWLGFSSLQGQAPGVLTVIADPGNLPPNTYQGTVTITSLYAVPQTQTIAVTFQVASTVPANMAVKTGPLSFAVTVGSLPATTQLTVSNQGGGTLSFSASAAIASGGAWLQVSPASGTATAATSASLTVMATPGALAVGTYTGSITVASATTGQTVTIPVTLAINPAPQTIVLSQTGLTFTAVAQGGSTIPQSIGILNTGSGSMTWTATAQTVSGSGWLSLSATTGTVNHPFLDVSFVDVIVNAQALAPGQYFGNVQVTAPGASNSPQAVVVVLNVLPAGSNPGPQLRPTGLVFTGIAGTENPGSQTVTIANVTSTPIVYGSSPTYVSAVNNAANWVTYLPANATVTPDTPATITVQPNITSLAPGVYHAALTLLFDDGSLRNVSILGVVAPPGTIPDARARSATAQTSACTPTKLLPIISQLGTGPSVSTGWPVAIVANVVDDCGSPVTSGSVVVSFSDGDPALSMISLGNGQWSATWQPQNSSPNGVMVSVLAREGGLTGTLQPPISIGFLGAQTLPTASGGVMNAVTLTQGPLAPGELVLIKGSGLADGLAVATSTPLAQQLGGASVLMGSGFANLLYADSGQLIGQVPINVPVNASQQILLERDSSYGVPTAVIFAAAQPAIFTENGSGQGLIYNASAMGGAVSLADSSNPVQPGGAVIIYCTGLGVTDAGGNASSVPALTIGGVTAQITYAGAALPANYPPSGAPMLLGLVSTRLGGLYQINATVPAGVAMGAAPVMISSAGQTSQAGVTIMVSGATGSTPQITAGGVVNAADYVAKVSRGSLAFAFGTNLASQAGQAQTLPLPMSLAGVSITVGGVPAPVFIVNNTFIEFQIPYEVSLGASVPVVVTTNGAPSNAVNVAVADYALGVFTYNRTATIIDPDVFHLNGTLLTPASPAVAGETVIVIANGIGKLNNPPATGAAVGPPYPTAIDMPVVTVGGVAAVSQYAGLLAGDLGVVQMNVQLPANLPGGSLPLVIQFPGDSSPAVNLYIASPSNGAARSAQR